MLQLNSSRDSTVLHEPVTKFTLLIAVIVVIASPASAEQWQFDEVERVVAIADVHGAYDAMVRGLQSAAVIDEQMAWTAGNAHLVMVGDIVDRGPNSRDAMDLLMRLETEAAAAGGMVHVLIGNHEAMNLVGDLRYVSDEEYAAFADEERAEDRDRWFGVYADRRASGDESPEGLSIGFAQRFPPGFFGHRRAFSSAGKYGKWLLTKPAVVVINGTAFVHGGLSPTIGQIGLDGVNGRLRGEMVDYVKQLEIVVEAGALLPTDGFHEHARLLGQYLPPLDTPIEVLVAIDAVKKLNGSRFHALDGPLWYRGNIVCSELIESDKLAGTLQAIGATRVVIGHTPTPGSRVLQRLNGRIIEIDTGMFNNYYGGSANVLILDDDSVSVVNETGDEAVAPLAHPREVGARPQGRLSTH